MCVSSPTLSKHSVCDPASPRHSNDRAGRLSAVPVGDVFQDAGKPVLQALSQDNAGSPVEEHASQGSQNHRNSPNRATRQSPRNAQRQ